jgi:hypothetical protein
MTLPKQYIVDFFEKLMKHDWYYEFADDHRAWRRGVEEYQQITLIAKENEVFERMKSDFVKWKFDKGSFPEIKNYFELQ